MIKTFIFKVYIKNDYSFSFLLNCCIIPKQKLENRYLLGMIIHIV